MATKSQKNTNSNTTVTTNNDSTFNLSTLDLTDLNLDVLDVVTALAVGIAKKVVKDAVTKVAKEIVHREKFPKPNEALQRLAEPSMKSYLNLYNNHRSVLTPDKVLRLEQKLSDMQKFSKVISDDLKVLIVDKVNGISASQGNVLQIKIMECLEQFVANNKDKEVPRFLETSYNFKCLKVVCANEYSLNWLKETIVTLSPWPQARLEVTFMSTYSVYSTVSQKRTPKAMPKEGQGRLKFAIPNNSATTATGGTPPAASTSNKFNEIAKQLELHNAPIEVANWKELHKEDKGAYTMYFVSMDLKCIEEIKKKGNRLFYQLGTIKVAQWNQNDEIFYKKKIQEQRKQKAAALAKAKAAGQKTPP